MDEEARAQYLRRIRALGPYLEERRVALELSQREMARRTGIAQSQLSRIESGSFDLDLGLRYVPALAQGYEIPAVELLERILPGITGITPASEAAGAELRPTRAYERSVAGLHDRMSSLRSELVGKLEELKSDQRALTEQLTEALDAIRAAATEVHALREALASASSQRAIAPSPQPVVSASKEGAAGRRSKVARSNE